jgi:hypothetical protein
MDMALAVSKVFLAFSEGEMNGYGQIFSRVKMETTHCLEAVVTIVFMVVMI